MQKARKSTGSDITVSVARLGEDEQEVVVTKDATVDDVLSEAGLSLSPSEKAYVNSDEAKGHFVVDEGDHISIIGKKEGGKEEATPDGEATEGSEDATEDSEEATEGGEEATPEATEGSSEEASA